MRSFQRSTPTSFFTGGELLRILAMLGMLAVTGALMFRVGDPKMWNWVGGGEEDRPKANAAAVEVGEKKPEPAKNEANEQRKQPEKGPSATGEAGGKEDDKKKASIAGATAAENKPEEIKPFELPGEFFLDENPMEREEFAKETLVIKDGSDEMTPLDMHAYWRLFHWANTQSFESLERRALKKLEEKKVKAFYYTDFIQRPQKMRAELVRLRLLVRRIREFPASQNDADVEKVYEIWGTTAESQSHLYCILTSELTPNLKVSESVNDNVEFAGYFFRVLGYIPRKSQPGDPMERAPMFIGRLHWTPPEAAPEGFNWALLYIGGAIVLVAIGGASILFQAYFKPPQKRHSLPPVGAEAAGINVGDWLADAENRAQREENTPDGTN